MWADHSAAVRKFDMALSGPRRRAGPALTALAALVMEAAAAAQGLVVTPLARRLAPGEVVLVKVAAEGITGVAAELSGHAVLFHETTPGQWQGLAGLDLELDPGTLTISGEARMSDGRLIPWEHTLRVRARSFPTRRLRVARDFVDPPAHVLDRIRTERELVDAVFDAVSPERFWAGRFVPPVPGAATSSFGRRTILNGREGSPHRGTDFRARTGTRVVAPNRGRVVLARDLYFSGRTVIVDHGQGLYSYLAHLSEIDVGEGVMVETGDALARSGSSGRVTGPHLHWSVRLGHASVDPQSLMAVSSSAE